MQPRNSPLQGEALDYIEQLQSSLSDRYDIDREIGAGGMATVYLARDLRHDRRVALKVLKPDLGAILGLERFLAEIKVTANLQHPNLLPLFDSGEANGLLFYVMPYVEGETLRNRLDREKQLPVDEAIRMSVAIANALEYAHAHNVIHRDLKPENILLQAGQPVIADFGIALAVSKAGGNRMTQTGLSLGTPAYMSPEQATGDRIIDCRSDIYSLGAMTYEMLTGEPPHTGNTSQAVIARMLTEKPRPIRTTRSMVPEYVEMAVMRALEKLPADRFSSAREYAEALHGRMDFAGATGVRTAASAQHRSPVPGFLSRFRDPLVASLAVLSLVLIGALAMRRPAADANRAPVRFVLAMPDSARAFSNFPWPGAISPNGTVVVYSVLKGDGTMLYVQRTNQLDGQPIPGTLGGSQPLFSPDGQSVAFEAGGKLKKVRLDGSAPIAVTDGDANNGADWTVRDEFVLGSERGMAGLSRVSASGGELTEFAKPDTAKGELAYLWPIASPDGKTVVFTIWSGNLASSRLATATIDKGDVVPLNIAGIRPLAMIGRILVYLRADGVTMAGELDRSGRHLSGAAVPVLDPVPVAAGNNGNSDIYVSSGGALLTSRGGRMSQMVWASRDGSVKPVSPEIRSYSGPVLSPDGQKIAVQISENDKEAVWIQDLATGTLSRLTTIRAAASPVWTPDSRSVLFVGEGEQKRFAIWKQNSNGGAPAEKLFETPALTRAITISPDGRTVLTVTYSNNNWNIFRIKPESSTVLSPYLTGAQGSFAPRFSPGGKWVAITSIETNQSEVFVRSYPDPSERIQISSGGGGSPTWSVDGSRIYYTSGSVLMSASLATTPTLRVLTRDTVLASPAFAIGGGSLAANYDIAREGRFLGLRNNKDDFQIVLVPDWLPELKQRMAGSRRK
ncbi:MAG: serine/threonine-protein kinase [Gemmatimonadaceae bacterium]|nr:serine/threonine-protein kinase [Gemmatimonadaceae bacterium]